MLPFDGFSCWGRSGVCFLPPYHLGFERGNLVSETLAILVSLVMRFPVLFIVSVDLHIEPSILVTLGDIVCKIWVITIIVSLGVVY